MQMATLTLKNPPAPKPVQVPETVVEAVETIEIPQSSYVIETVEATMMQIVDRHTTETAAFSIRKAGVFERVKGTKQLTQVGANYWVVDDTVLQTADLAVAIVNDKPFSTLAEARASIGRIVPDNNTDKTKPKSAYAAFSGPKASREMHKK
jgi:hypothetical protein